MAYLWLKALHVISIIAWMAGLLYLPRLFVYHAAEPAGSPASDTFKVMELRLFRYIMIPAMLASYLFGIWMIVELGACFLDDGLVARQDRPRSDPDGASTK